MILWITIWYRISCCEFLLGLFPAFGKYEAYLMIFLYIILLTKCRSFQIESMYLVQQQMKHYVYGKFIGGKSMSLILNQCFHYRQMDFAKTFIDNMLHVRKNVLQITTLHWYASCFGQNVIRSSLLSWLENAAKRYRYPTIKFIRYKAYVIFVNS